MLPGFLKSADVTCTHELLPLLCCHLQLYEDHDDVVRALIDALYKLSAKCSSRIASSAFEIDEKVSASQVAALDVLAGSLKNSVRDEPIKKALVRFSPTDVIIFLL